MIQRRRFYAPPGAFDNEKSRVTLEADEARHLKDVLRLRHGDEVFVFDGEGREFRCSVEEAGRHEASLSIAEEVVAAKPESPLKLTLAIALLKGEKLDLVVQKATELGVHRVVLVESELADVKARTGRERDRRVTRLKRIALEAAKQSGRARLTLIEGPVEVGEFLKTSSGDLRFFFSERQGASMNEARGRSSNESVTALIGPEGGWTDQEIESARTAGWVILTLGGRVLRAETAAIAFAAILQNIYGDVN